MRTTSFRAIALFLCCQPVLWMSNVALAQVAVGAPPAGGGAPAPAFTVPGLSTELRADRPATVPVAPPLDEPVDPDTYVCGTGDVLQLDFWGLQNFSVRVIVDVEGRAFVPKVGYFELRGRTLSEARRLLREAIARNYPRVSFDVSLAEPRTFLVQVADDVATPGSYPVRATDRVATVINRAGGFGANASRRRVEIRRRDGTVLRADLQLYALTGDVRHNPHLLDGDVVRVPFEEIAAVAGGAVNRPGRYELVGTKDAAELLDLAGGLAPSATRDLPIAVLRRGASEREDLVLVPFGEGGQLPVLPLRPDDVLRFPGVAELQPSITVVGAVAGAVAPGGPLTDEATVTRRVPFVQGDTVAALLERLGGIGPQADLRLAHVVHGAQTIPVDLYTLIVLRDRKADVPLAAGDTLAIPFYRRNVLVQGAVFNAGAFPYNPTFGVEQYLALAGGPSRNARSLDELRVTGPDGKSTRYQAGMPVVPGASLVLPERSFSRGEIVQIALSVASILVSGAAVAIALTK
jgi:protein involved in polysaccharide export with SLBB domain